jgi:hypothetical protein
MPTVENIIDAWFQDAIHDTIIQRDEQLYAKFYAKKEELKALLIPAAPVKADKTSTTKE